jgi:hypothetical protein
MATYCRCRTTAYGRIGAVEPAGSCELHELAEREFRFVHQRLLVQPAVGMQVDGGCLQ